MRGKGAGAQVQEGKSVIFSQQTFGATGTCTGTLEPALEHALEHALE